jgi:sulfur carrier protein ThiS
MTVSGQDFDIATANLTSAFTLTADADTQFSVIVALPSAFVMTTVAELLQQVNVERTIAVKSETRIVKALQDQRIIPVNSESRINIVLADSRTILVPDETRILKEP